MVAVGFNLRLPTVRPNGTGYASPGQRPGPQTKHNPKPQRGEIITRIHRIHFYVAPLGLCDFRFTRTPGRWPGLAYIGPLGLNHKSKTRFESTHSIPFPWVAQLASSCVRSIGNLSWTLNEK
jgi:hypothetical protein